MKSEKDLWKFINSRMGNRWDAQRHEDKTTLGIPDVSFGIDGINGWIELKYAKVYPKNPGTPVKFKHFTVFQKNWLERRQKYGGNCWLLIGIEDDIYIFEGGKVADIYFGKLSRQDLRKECFRHFTPHQSTSFKEWLSNCLISTCGKFKNKIS